jgi:hypothetical protein
MIEFAFDSTQLPVESLNLFEEKITSQRLRRRRQTSYIDSHRSILERTRPFSCIVPGLSRRTDYFFYRRPSTHRRNRPNWPQGRLNTAVLNVRPHLQYGRTTEFQPAAFCNCLSDASVDSTIRAWRF